MKIPPKNLDSILAFLPQEQRTLLEADVSSAKGEGLFGVRRDNTYLTGAELYACYVQLLNSMLAVEDLPGIGDLDYRQIWLSRIVSATAKEWSNGGIGPQLFTGEIVVKRVHDLGDELYVLDTGYNFGFGKKRGTLSARVQLHQYGLVEKTYQPRV